MNRRYLAMLTMLFLVVGTSFLALGEPEGVTIVSNTTESPTPQAAGSITTAGGSFTTLVLNATTQTQKWKGIRW